MKTQRYIPVLKGAIEGYIVNFLRRSYWKVEGSMEWEDALQEARLVFFKLASIYDTVEEPQHFMSLFKTALHRHFTDLANADTAMRAVKCSSQFTTVAEDEETGFSFDTIVGDLETDGAVRIMVQQAPREVKMVLSLFLNTPAELLELAQSAWKRNGNYRVDGNRMVNKLLGFPETQDSLGAVENYFVGPAV